VATFFLDQSISIDETRIQSRQNLSNDLKKSNIFFVRLVSRSVHANDFLKFVGGCERQSGRSMLA